MIPGNFLSSYDIVSENISNIDTNFNTKIKD